MKASFRNFDKNYVCTSVPLNQRFRVPLKLYPKNYYLLPGLPAQSLNRPPLSSDLHLPNLSWSSFFLLGMRIHSDIVFRSSAVGDITRDKYGYTSCPSLLTFYHLSLLAKFLMCMYLLCNTRVSSAPSKTYFQKKHCQTSSVKTF